MKIENESNIYLARRLDSTMDVKQAVKIAKEYVSEVFADEEVFNVGLEEVEFENGKWEVTIGFSRKWNLPPRSPFERIATGLPIDHREINRDFKVVEIHDESESVLSVRNRVGVM